MITTATKTANIKEEMKHWLERSNQMFDVMTFGELPLGALFVDLPRPGNGIGKPYGYRAEYALFKKVEHNSKELGPDLPFSPENPHGKFIAVFGRGALIAAPNDMPVVRVV